MKISKIFLFFFALLAVIFQLCWSFVNFLGIFLIFSVTAMILASILRLFFASFRVQKFSKIWQKMFINLWAVLGFLVGIILTFAVYQNEIEPAVLSNVTWQNNAWQKVVFVKMSHIAKDEFYNQKQKSVETLAQEWYTIVVEGVKPGSEASQSQFNAELGFDFTDDLYEKFAEILWYSAQKLDLYNQVSENLLVNIDLSLDNIIELLNQEKFDDNPKINNVQQQAVKVDELVYAVNSLSETQKFMLKYFVRAIFNWQVKQTGADISYMTQNNRLMHIILHKRNEPVVQFVQENPDKNIAIVYGALHYEGIMELLQKKDNSWKIISIDPFIPY